MTGMNECSWLDWFLPVPKEPVIQEELAARLLFQYVFVIYGSSGQRKHTPHQQITS